MKNYKAMLLVLLLSLAILLVSCTGDGADNGSTPANGENNTNAPANDEITVSEQVIFDQGGIKVTLKSFDADGLFGPSLKVLIENSSDSPVMVQARETSINGIVVDNIFSSDVASGKSANDEIVFMKEDIENAGIEVIRDIELKLSIYDPESWETIVESGTISITTSADPSYVQSYDDSGVAVLDKDGFKVVVKDADSESLLGTDVKVYLENNTEATVTIQVSDVSVNGYMIEPIFSVDLPAGKKAYDTITFLESDLEANGITSIDELELKVNIFDTETWEPILDSDAVKVSFK